LNADKDDDFVVGLDSNNIQEGSEDEEDDINKQDEESEIGQQKKHQRNTRYSTTQAINLQSSDNNKSSSTSSSSSSSSSQTDSASSNQTSFLISGRDVHGQYIKIVNESKEQGDLTDWSLHIHAPHSSRTFQIPIPANTVLQPGQSLVFRSRSQCNEDLEASEELVFLPDQAWTEAESYCVLKNPEGQALAKVEFKPNDAAKSCVIM
jgi:hypothetical protein